MPLSRASSTLCVIAISTLPLGAQVARRPPATARPAVVRLENPRAAALPEPAGIRMAGARAVQAVPPSNLEIFEGLTASGSYVLTANEMYVPNRGMLWFELGSVRAGPGGGYALTARNSDDFSDAYLMIYGAPGKTYLIDIVAGGGGSCVAAPCAPYTLTISQENGPRQVIEVPGGDNPHALFAFTAPTGGWYRFGLDYESAWLFRSATITVLQ